ncbi:hypothetical protein EHF_0729 [Ehrlichia japonica]|uniref:Uncharacterized protein n=1 Tax=Ehrlichia japonica TaxID=391036 RepID=X5H192_9RICK|nr:hypothetical protein EHF_0729 [Ehrlichia japonica]
MFAYKSTLCILLWHKYNMLHASIINCRTLEVLYAFVFYI